MSAGDNSKDLSKLSLNPDAFVFTPGKNIGAPSFVPNFGAPKPVIAPVAPPVVEPEEEDWDNDDEQPEQEPEPESRRSLEKFMKLEASFKTFHDLVVNNCSRMGKIILTKRFLCGSFVNERRTFP